MNFELKKIRLHQLKDFLESDFYKNSEIIPISTLRAASYLKNPNAKNEDVVLYFYQKDDRIIAFRTIWRDVIHHENQKITFGWLSGNWVKENYRGKGISGKLYQEVAKDWDNKLMYTNYAPESKRVYDKSTDFQTLTTLRGRRFYRRSDLAEILASKHSIFKSNKKTLKIFDKSLNLFHDQRLNSSTFEISNVKKVRSLKSIDREFIQGLTPKTFRRNSDSFEWCLHAWTNHEQNSKKEQKKYPFTVYAPDFSSQAYRFMNEEGKMIGFIVVNFRNSALKFPYLFFENKVNETLELFINQIVTALNPNTITAFHPEIISALENQKHLFTKNFEQKYFITKTLRELLPKDLKTNVQTGDGDGVFV